MSFCGGSDSKVSAYNEGDPGSIPGLGRSPGEGNGNPLQYSCLENPMDGGAWLATVHGVAKSWTRLSDFTITITMSSWPIYFFIIIYCPSLSLGIFFLKSTLTHNNLAILPFLINITMICLFSSF